MKKILLFFVIYSYVITNLFSQGIPYGEEFQVNTWTFERNDWECSPKLTTLKDGGFIVCCEIWEDQSNQIEVFGQLYNPNRTKRGNEFRINTYTQGFQYQSAIVGLSDGRFVVCWASSEQDGSGYGIFGQLFSSSGVKIENEFQVNTFIQGTQYRPQITGLSDGGFVVCWTHRHVDGSGASIFCQIFDSSGNKKGDEFPVNIATQSIQWRSSISALNTGNFVISSMYGINGQIFDAFGNKIGVMFHTDVKAHSITSTGLDNGDFVIVWEEYEQSSYKKDIFGQLFNATGAIKNNKFRINTYTQSDQAAPSVSGLSDGGFILCWQSYGQDGSGNGIFGQLYDINCIKIGREFQINTTFLSDQEKPAVVGLDNGEYVVCWNNRNPSTNKFQVIGKRFTNKPIIHLLQQFSLLDPKNDATHDTTEIQFKWQQPSKTRECYPWELTFDLYIDNNYNFSNPQIIKNIQDTTCTIDSLESGQTYFWKVLAKNLAGDSLWSSQQDWGFFIKPGATLVENADNGLPKNFELFQNYPNPFNSSTEIRYSIPQTSSSQHALIRIYDIRGRLVKVLVDQDQSGGIHTVSWDGLDMNGNGVSSGIYFYTLQTGSYKRTKKTLLLE